MCFPYLQSLYAVFKLSNRLLQFIHCPDGEQVDTVGRQIGTVPHHNSLNLRHIFRVSTAQQPCDAPASVRAGPAVLSLLALGQFPRQLTDGPLVRQYLVLLLQDRLLELFRGVAEVTPIVPRVKRRVFSLLLKVFRVALPGGDRRADEPAHGWVMPAETGHLVQSPETDIVSRRFRTMESAQRTDPGHRARWSGGLRCCVRIQWVVVGGGLALRRGRPGGSGVNSCDDADNGSDEGHHPGGQNHNNELQGGGGRDQFLEKSNN